MTTYTIHTGFTIHTGSIPVQRDDVRLTGVVVKRLPRLLWVRVEGKKQLFAWRDGRWVCEVLE